ncbi:UNVERIFIED_CONTAM: hypothetical protein K2H54_037342 [Gekko kuhli]
MGREEKNMRKNPMRRGQVSGGTGRSGATVQIERETLGMGVGESPWEGKPREPTVSSSQGDRGAIDGDRHGVVLAAMEMMLWLSLRGGRGRGGRRIHAGGTPRRADDPSPKDGAHPQSPGGTASRGYSQVGVLHGQMRRGKPTDRAPWIPAGQSGGDGS